MWSDWHEGEEPLTAEAMRQVAERAFYNETNDIIKNKVLPAAEKGKFSCSFDGTLSVDACKNLERLGYKVQRGMQYNEMYVTISWKRKEE